MGQALIVESVTTAPDTDRLIELGLVLDIGLHSDIAEICLTILTYPGNLVYICPIPDLLKYTVSDWTTPVRLSDTGSSNSRELLKDFLKPSSLRYV